MTRRSRRGSLLFPLALIFLGVMFLLTNLDVVDASIWGDIIRFWPVLLILLGIDTLLQRSSFATALTTVITTVVLIAAGIVLFHLFAPGEWITKQHAFSYELGAAAAGQIALTCDACRIEVDSAEGLAVESSLIRGNLTLRRDERLTEIVRQEGDTTSFSLEAQQRFPFLFFADSGSHLWDVALHPSVPLALSVTSNGIIRLDLAALFVQSADVTAGDSPCTIVLSQVADTALTLSGRNLTIRVPEDVGLHIVNPASAQVSVPDTYVTTERGLASPGYDRANVRSEIVLRAGAESIHIEPL